MSADVSLYATVLAVSADQMLLAPRQPDGCARCARGEGCGAGKLLAWWPQREWRLHKPSGLAAVRAGDVLLIRVPERHLLQASLILYGLPLFLFAVAALLSAAIGWTDAQAAMLAFAALALGLSGARWQARRHVRHGLSIAPAGDGVGLCA